MLIEAGRRISITSYSYQIPKKPTQFAMALRKYLRDSKLENVRQHDFDRIVVLSFKGKEGLFELHIELFGEGNIILVDEEGVIKHALKQKKMKDRTIARGIKLEYPPKRGLDPLTITPNQLYEAIKNEKTSLAAALVKHLNAPKELIEETLHQCKIPIDVKASDISGDKAEEIVNVMKKIIDQVKDGSLNPNIIYLNGNPITVLPIDFQSIEGERRYYQSFNQAVDDFFSKIFAGEVKKAMLSPVQEEIDKLRATLRQQQRKIEELEQEASRNYTLGHLVLNNLSLLDEALSQIVAMRKLGLTWEQVLSEVEKAKACNKLPLSIVEKVHPHEGILAVKLGDHEVKLSLSSRASEVAQHFFQRAKELSKKLEGAKAALKKTEEKIKELEKQVETIEQEEVLYKLPRKEWYEKFRWFKTSDGFLVIAGRDTSQNEAIVRKHLSPNDVFLHTVAPGGPVTVIKANGRQPSQKAIEEAAQFAASYSKAWSSRHAATEVFWVLGNQVSLSPPSGEYLPKGSFMIYGEKNFIKGVELKTAIGILRDGEFCKIVYGPPSAIKAQTKIFVELLPGDVPSNELAKAVKEALMRKAEEESLKRFIRSLPIEYFQQALPPKSGRIIE